MEKRGGDVPSQVWPIAAAAVMGISSSAALARGVAGEAAPAAIACWRVAGASALNLATRRARRGVAALDRRDATLAARSGLLLAAHFLLFSRAAAADVRAAIDDLGRPLPALGRPRG